jgi:AraC family transcriptional regulator of adaptative response/methylated-DNA-[protein]-cysteine methyltransferase
VTVAESRLGLLGIAATARGVAALVLADDEAGLDDALADALPDRPFLREGGVADAWVEAAQRAAAGTLSAEEARAAPLDCAGTPFQHLVWEALAHIPRGRTRTYGELAVHLGQPTATRAVATACAANPVALLIPCHRVVGADGQMRGYRWGTERKRRLLAWESGQGTTGSLF